MLRRIDEELAATARAQGCACGGVLHAASYPRKPRGGPQDLGAEHERRPSFCCARRGCRHRVTPPSVRFLGRKVYFGAVVVLTTVLRHGATPVRLSRLRELFGVSARTVARWRQWWQEVFVETPFWRALRGQFLPPITAAALPSDLLDRFSGEAAERLVALLRLIAPLTTSAVPGF